MHDPRPALKAFGAAGVLALGACAHAPGPNRLAADPPAGGPTGAQPKLGRPYRVGGVWYTPAEQPHYRATGEASWYGEAYSGRATADGERFDARALTGAHPTLPLPSMVEVLNLENGRRLRVRVNDRGAFRRGRVIDVSKAAAQRLGFLAQGRARVEVRYLGPAEPSD